MWLLGRWNGYIRTYKELGNIILLSFGGSWNGCGCFRSLERRVRMARMGGNDGPRTLEGLKETVHKRPSSATATMSLKEGSLEEGAHSYCFVKKTLQALSVRTKSKPPPGRGSIRSSIKLDDDLQWLTLRW